MSATVVQEAAPSPWLRWPARLYLRLKRPFLLHRVRRHTLETIDGVPLVVWGDVLNPVVFRSGEFLCRSLQSLVSSPRSSGGSPRALDMGTGSGAGAIFAARLGYEVVAVDLNPEAVKCARINVLLNGFEDQIHVRHGDLFAPVTGEKFDLVLFNPPFFRGEPKGLFDLAWRSTDVLERFAAGLVQMLTSDGEALILFSSDAEAASMLRTLEANGLHVSIARRKNFGNEIMTIYRAVRRAS